MTANDFGIEYGCPVCDYRTVLFDMTYLPADVRWSVPCPECPRPTPDAVLTGVPNAEGPVTRPALVRVGSEQWHDAREAAHA